MVRVRCRTNIDKYQRCEWPSVFECRPQLDDAVESLSGVRLRIVGITHTIEKHSTMPILEVELHLPKGMSIKDLGG